MIPCTSCKTSYNVLRQFVGLGGGGVGAVDIRGWGGGGCVVQNRESPDFRSPEVGRYAFHEQLNRIFADQLTVLKINFSFGFILRNTETGALQYHHPSANNHLVLEQPFLISSPDDLERLYQQIAEIDYLEWVRQQRPNSKWVVDLVTNVTWFV